MQILTILLLNAVVGVTQESSAEKAIAALQEYSANEAKVIRDGHLQKIKAEEIVPGDIVSVAVGDRIPADCRLLSIQSNAFGVDQAILTGESESVSKNCKAIKDPQAVKQDQINMLFSGTTVVSGHATAIAVLTGASTAIGDIHDSITSQISEPTPLKQKLNDFGDMLAKVITASASWCGSSTFNISTIPRTEIAGQKELSTTSKSRCRWVSPPFLKA